jgi:hypothetical protein
MRTLCVFFATPLFLFVSAGARADAPPVAAPPPDTAALVAAPKANEDVPKFDPQTNETTATVSAGGQLSTGNSQQAAVTGNGKFAMRRGADAFGAAIIGNYGEGASPGQGLRETTENLQGRLRYDRFVLDEVSLFLMGTALHDRFLGLEVRFNVDPGVKYIVYHTATTSLWGEAGYDFEYDDRLNSALYQKDAMGNTLVDANGNPVLLDKTATNESTRLFVGFKHAFNKEVNFTTGFEYLQSLITYNSFKYDYRFNYDALFAANIGSGLSIGVGFNARYDRAPLPGKVDLDTSTTVNLIYALSTAAKAPGPPAAPPPPCVPAMPTPGTNPVPPAPPATTPEATAPSATAPPAMAPATTAVPSAAPAATALPSAAPAATSVPSTQAPTPAPPPPPPLPSH